MSPFPFLSLFFLLALPYYKKHIRNFGEIEIVEFIKLFGEPEFTAPLAQNTPEARVKKLATGLKGKTQNAHIIKALDLIIAAPVVSKVHTTSAFKSSLEYLPAN